MYKGVALGCGDSLQQTGVGYETSRIERGEAIPNWGRLLP